MTDRETLRRLSARLVQLRAGLLAAYPFFGRLLLHLQIGFAECETAFTDMRRIVFDPDFAERLQDEELQFVFLHEIMHCVLHHCTRGRSLRPFLYNIACDIVVNSLILEAIGAEEFSIDGSSLIHLAPDGEEGRRYSAEEVYSMLLTASEDDVRTRYGASGLDTHIIWSQIAASVFDDIWQQYVQEAASFAGDGSGIPYGMQRYLKEVSHTPKTNWRQLLHDFIQNDRSDYVYSTPDHRFQGDILMPSFQDHVYGSAVDNIWFVMDTSGSVSDDALAEAYHEIQDAIEQIGDLSGELSFFDTEVTPPVPFSTAEELLSCRPLGGGGTSFREIFRYMFEHYEESLPKAVIVLTDGYAEFPDESAAGDVPVLWIIINSDAQVPWGECIHIES